MDKYYGDKKILSLIELEDKKTPTGSPFVRVMFEDGTNEDMPKVRFDLLVSDTAQDASTLQRVLNARVSSVLFSYLHEYGVKMGEAGQIVDGVVGLVNAGHARATGLLWGYEFSDIPLCNINNVLLENAKKSNDGTASVGGGSNPENKE